MAYPRPPVASLAQRTRIFPVRLSPPGQVTTGERVRLVLEVLVTYVPLLRLLRTNDLKAMIAGARRATHPIVLPPELHHETAVRLGAVVQGVLRLFPTDTRCLIRSLVLTRLLVNRSIDSTVHIGVTGSKDFGAHAWVEHDGVAVLPRGTFEPLTSL